MINGEAAKIINVSNAGYTCAAGDYNSLADNVIAMSELDQSKIEILSSNSLNYYKDNFDRVMLIDRAEESFKLLINN